MNSHPSPTGVPRATYRLQLGPDLDFAGAAELVQPLAKLGVSHLYLSPVCEAAPGSTHGYDVADPRRIATALGGEEGLRSLAERATAHGLGIIVDVVPNHMAAHLANPYWRELLANGRFGAAGGIFDVAWRSPVPGLEDKTIVPVLGDVYGRVLERGELSLVNDGDELALGYFDHRFPLSAESREAVERAGGPDEFAGTPGELVTYDRLHAVIEAQHYRLVHWRIGDRIVNYRRFFTITDLAAVRVEDAEVFDLVHGTLLRLIDEDVIDGLRIDHPDGLHDPARYFDRLAERSGGVWTVAEKITHPGETLPDWPVAGTTGYEFCNDVLGVLAIDPAAQEPLSRLDMELGGAGGYVGVAVAGMREILATGLAADVDRMARLLWRVTQSDIRVRDVDLDHCRDAISGIAAGIGVYRPYVDPQTRQASEFDREIVKSAVAGAITAQAAPPWLLEFTGRVVLGDAGDSPEHLELLARFPQLSSAAVAKGTEDTAFYRYRRMLALNEVGGDPGRFGLDVPAFHQANDERARRHPNAMLTTATHDTKRGEDTRLRMAALSEESSAWTAAVETWRSRLTEEIDGQVATLIWQTMIGIWPLSGRPGRTWRQRLVDYLVKAEREAAERTTWTDQNEAFERALGTFVDDLLADEEFLASFVPLATRASEIAMVTGLSQVLLRATAPGVPDTYQGMELWDDHLVDPDNRRAVDWSERRQIIGMLDDDHPRQLWDSRRDGRVKAHVLSRALRTRADVPSAFGAKATYRPLQANGHWADRLLVFTRQADDAQVIVIATRLPGPLIDAGGAVGDVWGDTALELPGEGELVDALTGRTYTTGTVRIAELLGDVPVALLSMRR